MDHQDPPQIYLLLVIKCTDCYPSKHSRTHMNQIISPYFPSYYSVLTSHNTNSPSQNLLLRYPLIFYFSLALSSSNHSCINNHILFSISAQFAILLRLQPLSNSALSLNDLYHRQFPCSNSHVVVIPFT